MKLSEFAIKFEKLHIDQGVQRHYIYNIYIISLGSGRRFTKRTILDVLHGSQNVYFLDLEMQTLSLMKLPEFAIKFEKLYIDQGVQRHFIYNIYIISLGSGRRRKITTARCMYYFSSKYSKINSKFECCADSCLQNLISAAFIKLDQA